MGQWRLGWSNTCLHVGTSMCQWSPVCRRSRGARSYLARASATVSHNLDGPLPGGGWSLWFCVCVCVCKSVCLSAYRNPLLSTLHIFDDHGIMCLQYSDYPPPHMHTQTPSALFFLFFKGSEHQQGPPFLWMSHICLLISAPIPLFLSLAPCFSLWLRLCLKD